MHESVMTRGPWAAVLVLCVASWGVACKDEGDGGNGTASQGQGSAMVILPPASDSTAGGTTAGMGSDGQTAGNGTMQSGDGTQTPPAGGGSMDGAGGDMSSGMMDTTPMGGDGDGGGAGMGSEMNEMPMDTTDPEVAQCIADVMAGGTTVGACEMCLCDKCRPELAAVGADANATALVDCQAATDCTGTCCLCGTTCDTLANFGMGPCGDETQTAAGVTPMSGLGGAIANGAIVMENCAPDGPDPNNACTKALVLGACVQMQCATECGEGPACE